MNIRDEIVTVRRRRTEQEGRALGADVPKRRSAPLMPFAASTLICEVKRRSPSRGWIDRDMDPVETASGYLRRGVRSLSVLTEEDHFGGSLADLMEIKRAHPEAAVLRKDFLLDEEDVELSWRAGADAVLLIASILSGEELSLLYRTARERGMTALMEIHGEEDARKVRPLRPDLVGINSRDLATFTVDPLLPIGLRDLVDWNARCVFESGIRFEEEARVALSSGFDALLVGESVVREPERIPRLLAAFDGRRFSFWRRLAGRRRADRPLVKICGLCREEDARLAAELGADVLGFVFASSPRRAEMKLIRKLAALDVPKAAVVVSDGSPPPEVEALLDEGIIDVVQFHGEEGPDECRLFPYYKALRIGGPGDLERRKLFRSPRVLLDAYAPGVPGGTGRRIPDRLLPETNAEPLWLAGGLGPDNVRSVVREHRPELVDASSGLETSPGRKDPQKLIRYFEEVARAYT